MKKVSLLIAVATMLLTACSSTSKTSSTETATTQTVVTTVELTTSDLEGKWLLQTINGEALPAVDTEEQPNMIFNFTEGRYACFLGCNRINGQVALEDGKIAFSNPLSTRMMCHLEAVMELENKVAFLLDEVTSASLSGNTLTLTTDEGKEIMTMTRE